jgi:CheY-like chemotaxis protein
MLFPDELEIEATESPEEALEWVSKKEVRIILSDLKMPGMDGSEFLSKIKEMEPVRIFV